MTPEDIQNQARAIREAGHVRRCHTMPHLGHYDVAGHSWQALALLYVLHPLPSPELIWALAFHDVAERYTGDIPAPAKWDSTDLADILAGLELKIQRALGVFRGLTPEEVIWLDCIDRLELLLWCEDQQAQGNKNAESANNAIRFWFREHWDQLPLPIAVFISSYTWKRGNDRL